MKRVTVRQLRLQWPELEKALARSGEIIVTRDAQPVARILPYVAPHRRRRRFDPEEHVRWLRRFWRGKKVVPSSDEWIRRDRSDE
jgi:antitoxin (DNA-binding transcriptional repressor) of toxin-antitoxin stability system